MAPQAIVFVLSLPFVMTFSCLHWLFITWIKLATFLLLRFSLHVCMCFSNGKKNRSLSSLTQIPSILPLICRGHKRWDGLENYKLTVIMFKICIKCKPGLFDVGLRVFCRSFSLKDLFLLIFSSYWRKEKRVEHMKVSNWAGWTQTVTFRKRRGNVQRMESPLKASWL